jgi:multiple sugar transport system ATP-binding protein
MTMGDRVALMRSGRLQQFATPQEVYNRPANVFVGGFIGSPAMNLVNGTIQRSNGDLTLLLGGQRLALDTPVLVQRPLLGDYHARHVIVGIRPEAIEDAALARELHEDRLLHGTVELREELGPELVVHFSAPDVQLADTASIAELPRDTGTLRGGSDSDGLLVGRFGPDSAVREGGSVDAVVDTGRLHFFDPDTGRGIYAIDKEGAIT